MIKSLTLRNFQSHKKTTLEFTPGINWIVGSSDSGKSAIMRSLRWAWFNKPTGFSFRSWWAEKEKTEVTVEHTDGSVIKRIRDTSNNKYEVNGSPLISFGNDAPELVADVADVNDLNIQQQGDAPFLLSTSAPEVARFLNSIANLTVIDDAHTNISGKMRSCDSDLMVARTARDNAKTTLLKFKEIDNLTAQIEHATEAEKQLGRIASSAQLLYGIIDKRNTLTKKIEVLQPVGPCVLLLNEADILGKALEQHLKEKESLQECVQKKNEVDRTLSVLTTVDFATSKEAVETANVAYVMTIAKLRRERDQLEQLITDRTEIQNRITALSPGVNDLAFTKAQIDNLTGLEAGLSKKIDALYSLRLLVENLDSVLLSITDTEQRLITRKQELDNIMPDVCPLCGAPQCQQPH